MTLQNCGRLSINSTATTMPQVLTQTAYKSSGTGGVTQEYRLDQVTRPRSFSLPSSSIPAHKFLVGTRLVLWGTRR